MRATPLLKRTIPLLALLAGACGAVPAFSSGEVGCRSAITPGGESASTRVRWVYIDDPEDRRFQDAWCAGVGPAVLWTPEAKPGPAPDRLAETTPEAAATSAAATGAALAASPADSLLVVAWNTAIGDGDLEGLVRDIRSGELTGAPDSAFVLLLQEVFRAGDGVPDAAKLSERVSSAHRPGVMAGADRDVVAMARALGLHLFYVPSMRNGTGYDEAEDRGNAILSTLPLSDMRALELPAGIQRRVAVQASVQGRDTIGPWQLRVVSAHLDNASASAPFASFGRVRGDQADGLVRMLPDDGATLVGGDFNTWFAQTSERAYRRMRNSFPYPLVPQRQPTAVRLGRGRVLDYLFFRGPAGWSMEDRRAASNYGSDHYPVWGYVHVGAQRAAEPSGEQQGPDTAAKG